MGLAANHSAGFISGWGSMRYAVLGTVLPYGRERERQTDRKRRGERERERQMDRDGHTEREVYRDRGRTKEPTSQ